MASPEFRARIKASRIAPVAALPLRTKLVGTHVTRELKAGGRWLVRSREHENFTYELTETNMRHLAWWVAGVARIDVAEARAYIDEIQSDADLRGHLETHARTGSQPGLADADVHYGRRLGWYALVRALKPQLVVETGTDKGLGSCVLAAALLKNGSGRLITMDVDPAAGHLIKAPYDAVVTISLGDSLQALRDLDEEVDLFLHDSLHTAEHERGEYAAIADNLAPTALVLSDNAHVTGELAQWAESTGRVFSYFDERPEAHWYKGAGIGAASVR